jgi:hypothetical protein
MTLIEAIQKLEEWPEYDAIYAVRSGKTWHEDALAVVVEEEEDGWLKQTFDGIEMECLLPVYLAREVVEIWQNWRTNAIPTVHDKLRAIVHYATFDAYLPLDEEIGILESRQEEPQ